MRDKIGSVLCILFLGLISCGVIVAVIFFIILPMSSVSPESSEFRVISTTVLYLDSSSETLVRIIFQGSLFSSTEENGWLWYYPLCLGLSKKISITEKISRSCWGKLPSVAFSIFLATKRTEEGEPEDLGKIIKSLKVPYGFKVSGYEIIPDSLAESKGEVLVGIVYEDSYWSGFSPHLVVDMEYFQEWPIEDN